MDIISEETENRANQANEPLIITFTPNEDDIRQSQGTLCSICQNGFTIGININKVSKNIITLDTLQSFLP